MMSRLPLTGAGPSSGLSYSGKVLSYSPIAYWMLNEAAGATAACLVDSPNQDAEVVGATLGQPGIGDGETSTYFSGGTDLVNAYTATFRDAFSEAAGTIAMWVKRVNWSTDGTCLMFSSDDEANFIRMRCRSNGEIRWYHKAGGTEDLVTKTSNTTTDWMHFAITWNVVGDAMIAYYNGVKEGSTQTGLGTWAKDLADDFTSIGVYVSESNEYVGWIAHVVVFDSTLGATAIADLATV